MKATRRTGEAELIGKDREISDLSQFHGVY
jgi:hypothetical protein